MRVSFTAILVVLLVSLMHPIGDVYAGQAKWKRHSEVGKASHYHGKVVHHPRKRQRHQQRQQRLQQSQQRHRVVYTAAHRTLPFGTRVKVTNLVNGKSIVVVINDRGPFIRGRVIDLSTAAFRRIGDLRKGLIRVKVETVAA